MNNTPWFMAGGAEPIVAWDYEEGKKYLFQGNNTEISDISNNRVEILAFFPCVLTAEQVGLFMDIEKRGQLIRGHYKSWEDFCQTHRVGSYKPPQ